MTTISTTIVLEKNTASFPVSFTDTTGAAVTPNSDLVWKLTDALGNVINSRSAVSITPATTVTIVLEGDDLALSSSYYGADRILTVTGTYNTTIGGTSYTNVPIHNDVIFKVTSLVGVS